MCHSTLTGQQAEQTCRRMEEGREGGGKERDREGEGRNEGREMEGRRKTGTEGGGREIEIVEEK